MPQPFAALEQRVNVACLAHLANVSATWQAAGGGATLEVDAIRPVPWIERTAAGTLEVVDHLRVAHDAWPDAASGDAVTCGGVTYRLLSIEPEGADLYGLRRANLARVS